MNAQLARAMIQRQYRGVTPPASITAPLPVLAPDHTTEDMRLATFDQSARTVGGKVAPFVSPVAAAIPQFPTAAELSYLRYVKRGKKTKQGVRGE